MLISAYDWDQQYLEEEQANRSVTGQDTIMTRATTDTQRNIEEQSLQVVHRGTVLELRCKCGTI